METSDMEEETKLCRFKVSSKLNKRAPVFIADFVHSRVKNSENAPKFEVFKSDKDLDDVSYEANRILRANSGYTDYTGSSPSEPQPFRNMIGVRDKTTGKMKLYDAVLFRMKPVMKDIVETDALPTSKTYWQGMQDLTENFGIKSQKRAMSAHLKHAADTSIDESSLNISDLDRTAIISGSQNVEYLPNINRQAQTPDQVFDIDEIISPDQDEMLEQEARRMIEDGGDGLSEFQSRSCKYVATHIEKLHGDVRRLKYLIYFNYLVAFQHLKYADLQKKDVLKDVPPPFKKKLFDNFSSTSVNEKTGKTTKGIPQNMKDKIVAHILVLALFIDDFLVNINSLLSNLNQVGLPKLTNIAHALGCHIKTIKSGDDNVKFIECKLPLYVLMPKYAKKQSSSKKS